MSSPGGSFFVGSAASGTSFRDAMASYRRSQYLTVDTAVASSNSDRTSTFLDDEHETPPRDEEDVFFDDDRTPMPGARGLGGDHFDWENTPPATRRPPMTIAQRPSSQAAAQEVTPLLRKSVSFSSGPHPSRRESVLKTPDEDRRSRRASTSSTLSTGTVRYNFGGQSTFGMSLFNCTAVLLGIGMLSEPYAFAQAGWIGGTCLIVACGWITCYTAKILAHIILSDPRVRSYGDIGRKAFGPRSTVLVSLLFCTELFAVSVILVTLSADSLKSLIPQYDTTTYKMWGLLFLLPSVFLPLSLLSYTSILGLLSTLLIILVIFVDGFSKPDAPGSFWSPAPTSMGPGNWQEVGVALGLFMAGFSGHAVIPSLAKDMINPEEFDTMINWAFLAASTVYALIGCAGYLMFGKNVQEEISMDIMETPGYNKAFNEIALWMLVIAPLSKYALATRPVNLTLEIYLGIDTTPEPVEGVNGKITEVKNYKFKRAMTAIERVLFVCASVAVSILIPEFSTAMAFLGSFSAFALCVIGPISAKIALQKKCGLFDGAALVLAVVLALWGTLAAFMTPA